MFVVCRPPNRLWLCVVQWWLDGLELEFGWSFMFGLCHDVTPLDKGHLRRLRFAFVQEIAQDESHAEPKTVHPAAEFNSCALETFVDGQKRDKGRC